MGTDFALPTLTHPSLYSRTECTGLLEGLVLLRVVSEATSPRPLTLCSTSPSLTRA